MRVQRRLVFGKPHIAVNAKQFWHIGLTRYATEILSQNLAQKLRWFLDALGVVFFARVEPILGIVVTQLGKERIAVVNQLRESIGGILLNSRPPS